MRTVMIALLGLGIASAAEAHGPPRMKTVQEVVIDAPADEVGARLDDFADLDWQTGVVSVDAPQGNTVDGTRTVTLDNGAVVTEELTKLDPAKRMISWRMVETNLDAIAVTNMSTVMTVKDEGGKAKVLMSGGFYRGFPNNEPPAELNDDAAVATVDAHFRKALDSIAAGFAATN